jgi:electron transfer flavoprotein alpha/beta subunit
MTRVVTLVGRGGALSLSMGLGGVCAIALAPPEGEAPLRAALAAGATRAVAVWDELLLHTDYYGLAQTLGCLARAVGFDILVCSDGACGLLGPAIADRLNVPHLSGVVSASFLEGRLRARRAAGAVVRTYAAPPPVLIGVARGSALPAVEGNFPVERLTLGEIGISAAELRWRKRFAPRPAAAAPVGRPRLFPDARALASRLAAEGLLAREPSPAAPGAAP